MKSFGCGQEEHSWILSSFPQNWFPLVYTPPPTVRKDFPFCCHSYYWRWLFRLGWRGIFKELSRISLMGSGADDHFLRGFLALCMRIFSSHSIAHILVGFLIFLMFSFWVLYIFWTWIPNKWIAGKCGPFTCFTVRCAVQKLLSFVRYHLSVVFISLGIGMLFANFLPVLVSGAFPLLVL